MNSNYEHKYLSLLAKEYPTVQEVSTELINLTAIMNLPKGTEHFLSDIHGDYDTFNHFLKNGSGVIKEKIDAVFANKTEQQRNQLSFFCYYPKQMLKKYEQLLSEEELDLFVRKILLDLIELSKTLSQKYTKSKISKSLPKPFAYIIQELLFETNKNTDKENYYYAILDAIFKTKREKNFLIELARFIQRLTIDRLHIVGDIFDRGPSAHLVMNKIAQYHSCDIEWGNHDIVWMGAAAGSTVSVSNVVRMCSKYNILDTLEEGYGINILPLATFASKIYQDDPCSLFEPKLFGLTIDDDKQKLVAKIHKAIAIIQFKLEKQVVDNHPEFKLDDRLLLHKIDYDNYTITIDDHLYHLKDMHFPTIDPKDPYRLTKAESDVIEQLRLSFLNNDLLQTHMKTMFQNGQMYLVYNRNLLFHGCIPLEADGRFASLEVDGKAYSGRALFEILESKVRSSYLNKYDKATSDLDYYVLLWQGELSPLFGKKAMKTFERYFIEDKRTHKEPKNNYFLLRENASILKMIYDDFGIDFETSKIINGHVPIDVSKGDSPILADGKIYSIDGGMSSTYQEQINIGGYTLISDSYKIFLISHERFESKEALIEKEEDIISLVQSSQINNEREYMYHTDKGQRLQEEIDDLYKLLEAYRKGTIKESKKTVR